MLQPSIYNTNKYNYTHFNAQKNCLQTTALRLLYLFPRSFFFPTIFSESKSRNFRSEATYIHPKKYKKHVHFTKVIFSTFLVPFSVTFIN